MIYKFVGLINREQLAEMKHDKQVCKSIYRGQSAEYSVIHRFPAISTESNLLRINMRNRFTTRSTEGSLLRLNIIFCNSIYRVWSAELKKDTRVHPRVGPIHFVRKLLMFC